MPRGWLMPCLPICTLVPAKALLTDSRVASATPTKRVQERVSKDFSSECRALPGRIGLMFIFGSSLLCSFLLVPCQPVCLTLYRAANLLEFVGCRAEARQPLVKRIT